MPQPPQVEPDARILRGYCLPEAQHVLRCPSDYSPEQVELAEASITQAVTEFGFACREDALAYDYQHPILSSRPRGPGSRP